MFVSDKKHPEYREWLLIGVLGDENNKALSRIEEIMKFVDKTNTNRLSAIHR